MRIPFLTFNIKGKYNILKESSVHRNFKTSKKICFILLKVIGKFSRILLDSFNGNKCITCLLKTIEL